MDRRVVGACCGPGTPVPLTRSCGRFMASDLGASAPPRSAAAREDLTSRLAVLRRANGTLGAGACCGSAREFTCGLRALRVSLRLVRIHLALARDEQLEEWHTR